MQSLILAASVAGLSAYALPSNATVTASPNIVYTTEVVTALTTYCPASTTLTFNSKTYTVTSATTLTITDCPCTVHKPVPTGHAQDECAKKCSNALFECKSKPDANQSSCVSEYNSCLGFQAIGDGKADYYPTACSKEGNNPPAPTGTGHAQDECAKKCSNALFDCKSKPDANQSTCVSNYNSCLGFQAIGGGKADYYPAACSKEGNTPAPTGTPGQGQGQTPPQGQGQTPPSGQGQTPPSGQGQTPPSGQGQTPPSGQGQTPPAGQGQGQDECAKKCVAALGDCKAQPGANQSFCVSSYNNCLGYMAIGDGKADYSPSACAPKATGTGATAVPTVPVTVGAAGIVRPVSLFVLGAVLLL